MFFQLGTTNGFSARRGNPILWECIELFSVTLWLELLSAGSKLLSAQSNAVSFAVSA